MKAGEIDERRSRIGLRWIGLGLWLALLAGSALIARAAGATTSALPYVTAAVLAAVGVVGMVAYARLSSAPPQLRTLRVLAILLPTLFIVCIEAILLLVEADELFTEVGEHVFVTALLSLSAIPFSVWIFRSFATLRDQFARHADDSSDSTAPRSPSRRTVGAAALRGDRARRSSRGRRRPGRAAGRSQPTVASRS